jgi:hypothetical protein
VKGFTGHDSEHFLFDWNNKILIWIGAGSNPALRTITQTNMHLDLVNQGQRPFSAVVLKPKS